MRRQQAERPGERADERADERAGGEDRGRSRGQGGTAVPRGAADAGELPVYAERVLDVAELIPPGRVMTYGDVAEWLDEGGPRQVGRVMALYGGAVPWWRVVRADGLPLPGHELEAVEAYRTEATPLRVAPRSAEGHLPRIDMKRARWDGGGAGDDGAGRAAERTGDRSHI